VVSFDLVLDEAKRSEVMTYGIGIRPKESGPGPTRAWNQAEYVLRTISFETGGKSFSVEDSKSLPGIYDQIARELMNQYTLGYVSTNPKRDGAWRKITVQLVPTDARARTRTGYFAPTTPR
jgi:VWFA-related protein